MNHFVPGDLFAWRGAHKLDRDPWYVFVVSVDSDVVTYLHSMSGTFESYDVTRYGFSNWVKKESVKLNE